MPRNILLLVKLARRFETFFGYIINNIPEGIYAHCVGKPQVSMVSVSNHVKLAQTLPPRLLRFFARYPPAALTSLHSSSGTSGTISTTTTLNTSSTDPNANFVETTAPTHDSSPNYENPFRSTKHPASGNWHDPIYSLRRQADLVKMARANGVEDLLPFTVKGTQERIRRREEHGLRVKGTGVGQKVKGKAWERTIKGRLEKRRQAMLEMPRMIRDWKQVMSVFRGSDRS